MSDVDKDWLIADSLRANFNSADSHVYLEDNGESFYIYPDDMDKLCEWWQKARSRAGEI